MHFIEAQRPGGDQLNDASIVVLALSYAPPILPPPSLLLAPRLSDSVANSLDRSRPLLPPTHYSIAHADHSCGLREYFNLLLADHRVLRTTSA